MIASNLYMLKVQARSIRTQALAEAALQKVATSNIGSLDVNLWQGGAHYKTALYPRCTSISPASFDPLGYMLKRGAELGIEIYAWFCPGAYWSFFPQWDLYGKHGNCPKHWFDFSILEARQKMAATIAELCTNYPELGGKISLDYIRYTDASKTATTPAWWPGMPGTGLSPADITNTVELVKVAAGIGGTLQAHVRHNDWHEIFQEWPDWLRSGLIGRAMPMMYANPAMDGGHQIALWLRQIALLNLPKEQISPCITWVNFNVTPNVNKSVQQFALEVEDTKAAGYKGRQYFDDLSLTPEFITYLAKEHKPSIKAELLKIAANLATLMMIMDAKIAEVDGEATSILDRTAKLQARSTELHTEVASLQATISALQTLAGQLP